MRLSCRSPSVLITSAKRIARDLQIAVAQFAGRIDKRSRGTKTARNIEVDEIGGGVVGAALVEIVLHAPPDQVNLRKAVQRAVAPARRRPVGDSVRV